MEEIRQDSADKGLLEPEAVNEDDNKSNIIVYQIEDTRNCEYAFMSYDFAKEHNGPNMKDYKKVAEIDMSDLVGEDVEDKLESIFAFGNLKQNYYDNNPGARSISVSDIIEMNGDKYYVDIVGFKKLDNKVNESVITEDDKGYIKQVLGIESGSDEETQLDNIFDTDYSLVWDELDDEEKKEYLKVAKSIRTLKPDEAFIDIEKEVKQKAKENHLEADILTYVYMNRYNKVEETAVNENDENVAIVDRPTNFEYGKYEGIIEPNGNVTYNMGTSRYRMGKKFNYNDVDDTPFPVTDNEIVKQIIKRTILKDKENKITEATVSKDLHEVKSQGNIYMLQDNDKYIVGENYDSKEKLIENAEIYNNKEEADKDYLNRCGIKID
jgi:hypothetical protein